jgi:hypothetical protein
MFVYEYLVTVIHIFVNLLPNWVRHLHPAAGSAIWDKELIKYGHLTEDRLKRAVSERGRGDTTNHYDRRLFPSDKKLPEDGVNVQRMVQVGNEILAHLDQLDADEAFHFMAELTVAWCFSYPVILAQDLLPEINQAVEREHGNEILEPDEKFAFILWETISYNWDLMWW